MIPDGKDKAGREDGTMPLTGHLRELRKRILVCAAVLIAAFLILLAKADALVAFLMSMGEKYAYRFVYIAPQELLLEYFQTAFVFAAAITLPLILYEVWAFANPGLTKGEKTAFLLVLLGGMVFAVLGILFAYFVMMPFMLRFLAALGSGTAIEASISVQNYVSFLLTVFILFAAVFEMPVVFGTLCGMGILKSSFLKKGRRVIIVLIFLIAAFITPPDITSQIMVALPMILLFEVSILIGMLVEKIKSKKAIT